MSAIQFVPALGWAATPAVLLALALGGCDDPAIERGRSPPLVLNQLSVAIPLDRPGADAAVARQVSALAAVGDPGRLRARIGVADQVRGSALRTLLVRLGLDPARITVARDARDLVVVLRTDAAGAPCETALTPAWNGDVSNSLEAIGTCVQAQALAAMIADPGDIAAPLRLQPAAGTVAARAVHRWEEGAVSAPAPESTSGSGGSGGSQSAPVTAQAQSPPAGLNPLMSPLPPSVTPSGPSTE